MGESLGMSFVSEIPHTMRRTFGLFAYMRKCILVQILAQAHVSIYQHILESWLILNQIISYFKVFNPIDNAVIFKYISICPLNKKHQKEVYRPTLNFYRVLNSFHACTDNLNQDFFLM